MEVLIVLFVLGLVVAIPVAGLAALVRLLRLGREVGEIERRLGSIEERVSRLAGREEAFRAHTEPLRAPAPEAVGGAQQPAIPDATAGGAGAPPQATGDAVAPPPPPAFEPSPDEPAAALPEAPTAPGEAAAGPPPPPLPPSAPPGPGFDWESLLGVRGAAWVGGIAVFVSAILFAKFAIDRDLITPELRIALLVLAGVGSLVGAELSLRRGYAATANAVSGAGIAILYVAFYAAHALYGLIGTGTAFALMALVTAVACVVAIHYDAYFTAVLGLLGGFSTPLLLSTGEDRPIGLFSYILLLNLGLSSVALRKRWHGLVLLACAATFLIELGWFARQLTPQKTLVGLVAFLLFGLLFLLLPLARRDDPAGDSAQLLRAGALGGVAPFLFALLIAGDARFAAEWPLLFGFVALLLVALAAIALLRGRVALLVAGALATAVTLPLWAAQGLSAANALAATLAAVALALLANAPRRIAERFSLRGFAERSGAFEAAGLVAGVGLGLYAFVLAAKAPVSSPWPFVAAVAGITLLLLERTRAGAPPFAMPLGALATAALVQFWLLFQSTGTTFPRNLALPLLYAAALSVAVAIRGRARGWEAMQEAGALLASGTALLGLFASLHSSTFAAHPPPLLAALAAATLLLGVSSLRSAWGGASFCALLGVSLFLRSWQELYLRSADAPLLFGAGAAFYLAFLAAPFLVPDSLGAAWKRSAWVWSASALAGPLLFPALHHAAVRAWGKDFIGLLPVAMAAATLPALRGVGRRFSATAGAVAGERLRYLALFAAVALGLVAVAIPLQLEKQWITLAWALEAAAVFRLFGRLPHPGLRLFGAVLFALVGARLLLNPELLAYHERGWPILNWLLYTYGIAASSCLLGARWLSRAEGEGRLRQRGVRPTRVPQAVSLLGLLLVFALVNLEIADYFSPGRALVLTGVSGYARDLTTSTAWGIYAMLLLVVGVWRGVRELRYLSLAFLLLTVGKVFLYDLSNVGGLYRILSFFGLGVSLILVSLFYQRFVFRREPGA